MLSSFAVVMSVLALGQCVAVPMTIGKPISPKPHTIMTIQREIAAQAHKVGIDLCPTCIQFTGEAINELLNIILNAGVVGTCGTLCNLLAQKTGSQALGAVCSILCDIVGIEEFVKLVEKADLDPIYFCEMLTVCPVNDHGDAKITQFTATPPSGPQGTFQFDLAYTSKNGTGTGEIVMIVDTIDHIPVSGGFLRAAQQPGDYGSRITLKAQPDPNCDPTQQPCEQWSPGVYNVKIDVCNGECGSKHPHSQIYDTAYTNFTITG